MLFSDNLKATNDFVKSLPDRRRPINPELYLTLTHALEARDKDLIVDTLEKINALADEAIQNQEAINSELKEKLLVLEMTVQQLVEPG